MELYCGIVVPVKLLTLDVIRTDGYVLVSRALPKL